MDKDQILLNNYEHLKNIGLKHLKDKSLIYDAIHDTYLKFLKNESASYSNVVHYLGKILINTCKDYNKKNNKLVFNEDFLGSLPSSAEDDIKFNKLITLKDNDLNLLTDYYVLKMPVNKICTKYNISISKLKRKIKILKEFLKSEQN